MANDPDQSVFARFFRRVPKQARSRALVDSILQALEEHGSQDPSLEQLRVESLAERAGVGIGSLYEYFSSKDSLLGALVGRATKKNFDELMAHASGLEGDLEAAVRQMSARVTEQYLARPRGTRLLMTAIAKLDLWDVVVAERDRFSEGLVGLALARSPHLDRERLAATMRLLPDSVMGVLSGELTRHDRPDLRRTSELVADVAWGVVLARHPTAKTAASAAQS